MAGLSGLGLALIKARDWLRGDYQLDELWTRINYQASVYQNLQRTDLVPRWGEVTRRVTKDLMTGEVLQDVGKEWLQSQPASRGRS